MAILLSIHKYSKGKTWKWANIKEQVFNYHREYPNTESEVCNFALIVCHDTPNMSLDNYKALVS